MNSRQRKQHNRERNLVAQGREVDTLRKALQAREAELEQAMHQKNRQVVSLQEKLSQVGGELTALGLQNKELVLKAELLGSTYARLEAVRQANEDLKDELSDQDRVTARLREDVKELPKLRRRLQKRGGDLAKAWSATCALKREQANV